MAGSSARYAWDHTRPDLHASIDLPLAAAGERLQRLSPPIVRGAPRAHEDVSKYRRAPASPAGWRSICHPAQRTVHGRLPGCSEPAFLESSRDVPEVRQSQRLGNHAVRGSARGVACEVLPVVAYSARVLTPSGAFQRTFYEC